MIVQKNQIKKLVLNDIKDNAKNNTTQNNTLAVYIVSQYANRKQRLIILLLFNQKTQQ